MKWGKSHINLGKLLHFYGRFWNYGNFVLLLGLSDCFVVSRGWGFEWGITLHMFWGFLDWQGFQGSQLKIFPNSWKNYKVHSGVVDWEMAMNERTFSDISKKWHRKIMKNMCFNLPSSLVMSVMNKHQKNTSRNWSCWTLSKQSKFMFHSKFMLSGLSGSNSMKTAQNSNHYPYNMYLNFKSYSIRI